MPVKNKFQSDVLFKIYVFIAIELFLYFYFLYLDFQVINISSPSGYIKFLSITFCCLLFFFLNEKSSFNSYFTLTRIALILTLWADVFLLFTSYYTVGILLFSMVQGCYHLRLRPNQSLRSYYTAVLCGFFPVLLLLRCMGIAINASLISAVFYFICLLYNGITSMKQLGQPGIPSLEKLFSIGILLLFLCDIQVGIYNVSSYINTASINTTFLSMIQEFSSVGMWVFYLPSQVIVTLCGILT